MRSWLFRFFFPVLLIGCMPDPNAAPEIDTFSGQTTVVDVTTLIESAHPYANNTRMEWVIEAPGEATAVTVTFDRFETEFYYDYVDLIDQDDRIVHRVTGNRSGYSYRVEGPRMRVRLVTDHSVRRWGFRITRYSYELQETTRHRPVCLYEGTRSEGWYWEDTGEWIAWAFCADMETPYCAFIGTRSEGWYTDHGLITWAFCHQEVGIAIAGEPCGPQSGLGCYRELYCANQDAEGNGTCRWFGSCDIPADCENPENIWIRPWCEGTITCRENMCGVDCDTSLVGGMEGDPCMADSECQDDLTCKNLVNGQGTCQGETWCMHETVDADCANVPHIAVPGTWRCNENNCQWERSSLPPMVVIGDENVAIPDNSHAGVNSVAVVDYAFCANPEITVSFIIRHTWIGDLVVELFDPAGQNMVLHNRTGGSTHDLVFSHHPVSIGNFGMGGNWRLFVRDLAPWDTGYIETFQLMFACRP